MAAVIILKDIPKDLDVFDGEILISLVAEDEKPLLGVNAWIDWRLYGTITQLMFSGYFKAQLGEKCLLPTYGKFKFDRIVMIGMGPCKDREIGWGSIFQIVRETTESLKVDNMGLCLPRFSMSEYERQTLKTIQESHLPFQTSIFVSRSSSRISA